MSITSNIDTLKLNLLTTAQYEAATKSENELYLLTDSQISAAALISTLQSATATELASIKTLLGIS